MTLTFAVALNAILAAGVVAALVYVCRLPYRLDRLGRAKPASETVDAIAYERAAA
jgi:hypothetical protein